MEATKSIMFATLQETFSKVLQDNAVLFEGSKSPLVFIEQEVKVNIRVYQQIMCYPGCQQYCEVNMSFIKLVQK